MYNGKELDHVISLHCRDWPSAQEEWLHRHRAFNWPSPELIKQISQGGCELVSVGSHLSNGSPLEWRISSSFAEKLLIRSFNIYQIQCYFLLKLILTFLIKPLLPETLCSYHMKTVMLHIVESTDPEIWREDNLSNCFITCLQGLRMYLKADFLPQYFILTHNLLIPKITEKRGRYCWKLFLT